MLVILWSDTTYELVESSKNRSQKTEKQSRVLDIMLLKHCCVRIFNFLVGGGGGVISPLYVSIICIDYTGTGLL